MKKLLILTFLSLLLSGASGCKFFDCLFRGGPAKEPCPCQPATVVTSPCCDSPCGGGCSGATVVSPGCSSCAGGAPVTTTTTTNSNLPGPTTYTNGK